MIRILLSARLGELRWTQADLARKTGIRASTIGDYYNEMTDRVSLRHLERICSALECDLPDLLAIVPEKEDGMLGDRTRSGQVVKAPVRRKK